MQEPLYEEYAVLNIQIKELTLKKDELKVKIVEDLMNRVHNSLDSAVGKFSITQLKTWTYTPKVEALNEKLKAQKATEESTGDATYEEKPSLRFSEVKF